MPIQLTTPRVLPSTPEHPGGTYEFVEVVGMEVETLDDQMILTMQYGTRDGAGAWVPSPEPLYKIRIRDVPADLRGDVDPADGQYKMMEVSPADPRFSTLIATALTSAAGTPIWGEVQFALYGWLLTHGPEDGSSAAYYEGTAIP